MAQDTLASLVGKVQQRVGMLPDVFLVQEWLSAGLKDVYDRIDWTWKRRSGQMIFFAPINTGAVTIYRGDSIATFSGAPALTADVIGRQLRVAGNNTRITTIVDLLSTSTVVLDLPWGDIDVTAKGFEIYCCYQTMPDDFESFKTIVDLQRNFQLDWWGHTHAELDRTDPRRSYGGSVAYWCVLKDYTTEQSDGAVAAVQQVSGAGSVPLSGGSYKGMADALLVVKMTSGTTFQWRKNTGGWSSDITIDPAGETQGLAEGVEITFPTTGAYVTSDVFVIRVTAAPNPGAQRYELWPHIKTDEIRPYYYTARMPDLTDPGVVLPRAVRGDILVEKALAKCAAWKHPDNGYFDLKLAGYHEMNAERMIEDMERKDQALETEDITYNEWLMMPVYDSAYLAGHDIGYEIDTLY